MEKRDWQYWLERLKAVNEGKAPTLTDDEITEMFQCPDPPGYSPEEITHIKQHGTRREKMTLEIAEHLRAERDKLKKQFFEQQKENK